MAETEWHDWVGELFEPAFGTIEDLVSHEDTDSAARVKHVSPYDPDAVKKVYEKVHMMTMLDEEMREQEREKKKQTTLTRTSGSTRTGGIQTQLGGDLTVKDEGKVLVDLNDSCIWDSREIAVLRHAFKSIKQKNIETMVHVREVEKRNRELEELTTQQGKKLSAQKLKLFDATQANGRLKIHCDSLQSDLDYCLAKVSAMEEILAEIKQEKADMVKELHDNRVSTDRERLERERIQLRLDTLRQEALADKMAAEDNVKTMCKQVILDLQKKVKTLTDELNKEKNLRKNTDKGLKHLRHHFASLSVQEILPTNAVKQDQVKHIDY